VYTRIVESDLIPTDQREEILKRLMPALSESESRPVDEASGRGTSARALRTSTLLLSALAGAASLIGGIVSILPDIASASTKFRDAVVPAVATIVTSLAVLSAIIALYRLRASQEAVDTKAGEVDRYVAFEMEVARLLRRLGANPIRGRPDEGVDFIIELHDKRILVEVKSWSQPMPTKLVAELAERLVNALKRTQASEAIVVTPEPLREPVPLSADSKVKFMTPQQLRNYLAHSKGGRDAV
jgi:Holliday junction resolvase